MANTYDTKLVTKIQAKQTCTYRLCRALGLMVDLLILLTATFVAWRGWADLHRPFVSYPSGLGHLVILMPVVLAGILRAVRFSFGRFAGFGCRFSTSLVHATWETISSRCPLAFAWGIALQTCKGLLLRHSNYTMQASHTSFYHIKSLCRHVYCWTFEALTCSEKYVSVP